MPLQGGSVRVGEGVGANVNRYTVNDRSRDGNDGRDVAVQAGVKCAHAALAAFWIPVVKRHHRRMASKPSSTTIGERVMASSCGNRSIWRSSWCNVNP